MYFIFSEPNNNQEILKLLVKPIFNAWVIRPAVGQAMQPPLKINMAARTNSYSKDNDFSLN